MKEGVRGEANVAGRASERERRRKEYLNRKPGTESERERGDCSSLLRGAHIALGLSNLLKPRVPGSSSARISVSFRPAMLVYFLFPATSHQPVPKSVRVATNADDRQCCGPSSGASLHALPCRVLPSSTCHVSRLLAQVKSIRSKRATSYIASSPLLTRA